jgi:hypothetical protein
VPFTSNPASHYSSGGGSQMGSEYQFPVFSNDDASQQPHGGGGHGGHGGDDGMGGGGGAVQVDCRFAV